MVLGYWDHNVVPHAAADATYDYVYEGSGSWSFNALPGPDRTA